MSSVQVSMPSTPGDASLLDQHLPAIRIVKDDGSKLSFGEIIVGMEAQDIEKIIKRVISAGHLDWMEEMKKWHHSRETGVAFGDAYSVSDDSVLFTTVHQNPAPGSTNNPHKFVAYCLRKQKEGVVSLMTGMNAALEVEDGLHQILVNTKRLKCGKTLDNVKELSVLVIPLHGLLEKEEEAGILDVYADRIPQGRGVWAPNPRWQGKSLMDILTEMNKSGFGPSKVQVVMRHHHPCLRVLLGPEDYLKALRVLPKMDLKHVAMTASPISTIMVGVRTSGSKARMLRGIEQMIETVEDKYESIVWGPTRGIGTKWEALAYVDKKVTDADAFTVEGELWEGWMAARAEGFAIGKMKDAAKEVLDKVEQDEFSGAAEEDMAEDEKESLLADSEAFRGRMSVVKEATSKLVMRWRNLQLTEEVVRAVVGVIGARRPYSDDECEALVVKIGEAKGPADFTSDEGGDTMGEGGAATQASIEAVTRLREVVGVVPPSRTAQQLSMSQRLRALKPAVLARRSAQSPQAKPAASR